jgi:hypothetical protein
MKDSLSAWAELQTGRWCPLELKRLVLIVVVVVVVVVVVIVSSK